MAYILMACLEKLMFGIGDKQSDSVFARSFSALVLALIIEKDRELGFLSENQVLEVIEASLTYLILEQDIRGYVEGKGWAHSIAHGADLLAEVVKHPYFKIDLDLGTKCLEVIKECLFKLNPNQLPYIDGEEERLIFVLENLIKKGVTEVTIKQWIEELSAELSSLLSKEGFSLGYFRKRTSVINLLRSLYFRLIYKDKESPLLDPITKVLEDLHHQLYQY